MSAPPGRATTAEQKLDVLAWVYAAWLAHPELRLGQLICGLTYERAKATEDPFYVEDAELAEIAEGMAKGRKP